ncbi:MAG: methionyl-tRNA formyltransferase [Candidatus Peregrinibacteria bacterium]
MKIIFFGTSQFAVPTLEILENLPHMEILAVVTQPDKPAGRGKLLTEPPVKTTAKKFGLKILQPKDKTELKENLKNTSADFFIVVSYGMILPKEILKIPKYGAINVHGSLLPKYRGASPIQECLLNGDKETGVSIMKMDEKLDHGPIYMIKRIKITNDNAQSLTKSLSRLAAATLAVALEEIVQADLQPIPQNEDKATYCRKIKKENGKIDFSAKTAEEIANMTKAYTPWPSVFTTFKGKKIKLTEADFSPEQADKSPGTFFLDNGILKISTKKGTLLPKKLQMEGKKEVDAKSFINGYRNML